MRRVFAAATAGVALLPVVIDVTAQPAVLVAYQARPPAGGPSERKDDDVIWGMFVWGVVGGGWILRRRLEQRRRDRQRPHHAPTAPRPRRSFGPSGVRQSDARIVFTDQSPDAALSSTTLRSPTDLRDAVTGQALTARDVSQCGRCHVFYHRESVAFLRNENGGRCVACGAPAIASVARPAPARSTPHHDPGVTTLADYRSKVGQMVIFEGRCVSVRVSAHRSTYAAMFESGHWNRSFKLVFVSDSVTAVGGPDFIWSLSGRYIRVRGFIVQHPIYGYEILVNDRSMILRVWG